MAKSLPKSLLWIALVLVTDASRSSVSVNQEAPTGGAQMLQIESKGRKEGIVQQLAGEGLVKATKPTCRADAVIFDFENAEVLHNNLGNQGPDTCEQHTIRYGNVGQFEEESFDMIISVDGDYVASNKMLNGLRGKSGQVNSNVNHDAKLTFTMVRSGSDEAIELPAFYISVYDIDQNGYMKEEVEVSGYDEITIPDDAEFGNVDTDTGKKLTSQEFGRICDNPEEPTNLHVINCYGTDQVDQRRRAFTMLFTQKSSFEMTFRVLLTRQNVDPYRQGRNLLFGGPTNLIEPCDAVDATTTTTTCAVTTASTTPPCVPDVVVFDFENAEVTHNNLGGQGPDEGEEYVLYEKIGTINGQAFDMKVVVNNENYAAGKPEKTGLEGKSGQINTKVDHHADLTFSFVDCDTHDTSVTLPAFYISIFDLDWGPASDEIVIVNGYESIAIPDDHEYSIEDGPDIDGKTFTATMEGNACDNPQNPAELTVVTCKGLTVDTRKRSFSMLFKDKSSFNIVFEAPAKPNTEELRAQFPKAGRNLQFAGTSGLSDQCA